MAIHCGAIQGRHDAIKELLNNDPDELIIKELANENEVTKSFHICRFPQSGYV